MLALYLYLDSIFILLFFSMKQKTRNEVRNEFDLFQNLPMGWENFTGQANGNKIIFFEFRENKKSLVSLQD